jgi:hypothetical protein
VLKTLTVDPGIKPMESGVPYYGTWDYEIGGVQGSFSLVEFVEDGEGRPGGMAAECCASMYVEGQVYIHDGENEFRYNTMIDAKADGTQFIDLSNGHITRR